MKRINILEKIVLINIDSYNLQKKVAASLIGFNP